MNNTIMVVEDDENLSLGIEYTLTNEGFNVSTAKNLKQAKEIFLNDTYDLILLDVMLPDGSGYDFCKHIRAINDIPIIFLTACDEEVNIVLGLDLGADDYITKPFRIKELLSRVKAVLRRYNKNHKKEELFIIGDIKVNTQLCKVQKRDNEISLTALEYKLFLTFLQNSKQVLSRNTILDKIWDIDGEFIDGNSLSVYIRRLREKIEDNPAKPVYILTVRGIGYKLGVEVGRNTFEDNF